LKVEGDAVTPAGSPLTATLMVPENPLRAVADRLTGCWVPCVRLKFEVLAEIEKSGLLPPPPVPPPPPPPPVPPLAKWPPQPQIDAAERARASQKNRICRGISIRSVALL